MNGPFKIVIAGAGGIAEAAVVLLLEYSKVVPKIFLGNRNLEKAEKLVKHISKGTSKSARIQPFLLPEDEETSEMQELLEKADILLDCLPGKQAPRMAGLARKYHLHYANLTEYVKETEEIIALAEGAETGFILQTGLAPGYINVLGHKLFRDFCADFRVEKVDRLEMKVGALGMNAAAPHYYGFTWSPVGVATEYLKPAITIRDYNIRSLPALSSRKKIIIGGITYEEALTSGGAADLPTALEGKVKNLDYKTLRHPGHYKWIEKQIESMGPDKEEIIHLQQKMEEAIPHLDDDQVIIYAAVEGRDSRGVLRRREISKRVLPANFGDIRLRAIQITTAAPLLQSAQLLLENRTQGVILQSELDSVEFLNGDFVNPVYGKLYND